MPYADERWLTFRLGQILHILDVEMYDRILDLAIQRQLPVHRIVLDLLQLGLYAMHGNSTAVATLRAALTPRPQTAPHPTPAEVPLHLDPTYQARIEAVTDINLRTVWRDGAWDILEE